MELLKLNNIEQNALIKLSPSMRKSAVDRLRQYYALLFHPDITGSYNSPLAGINANLDNLERGIYKTSPDNKTDISLVNKLKEEIKQCEAQIKQLKAEIWNKQSYINEVGLGINKKNKRPATKMAGGGSCTGIENPQDIAKLVKFFEILVKIDRRQKRDQKNN